MTTRIYTPASDRYAGGMPYRRCGQSGVMLPQLSLGFWLNFGSESNRRKMHSIIYYAFDHGITHLDLANNYGPPVGAAESLLGSMMQTSLKPFRDELFISTKAGHEMWPGPYGEWGSRKQLMSSIDRSLQRLHVDYVDLFYSHRFDPDTPLEETLQALVDIVKQGKALYVGISKYPPEAAEKAYRYLAAHDVHCLAYQGKYNLLHRDVEENGILQQAATAGSGFVAFSPLAQGLLTDRYAGGTVPNGSRMASGQFLRPEMLTPQLMERLERYREVARGRGETLAAMSLAWLLHDERVSSVIIGASSIAQLEENLKAVHRAPFSHEELALLAQS
ncbi:MAG: aldo/keto reductase [Prevotellaceae bacterium]|jgi:L-glyceraldehyde 3-phosphate reductase|nr:aldo/keto reductase [Prevotellaceae bacterium]